MLAVSKSDSNAKTAPALWSSTWVIIAAFNEERDVRAVVDEVLSYGYSVVVVDDCSSDGTWDALAGSGAHTCRHAINLGQGAALQTGIAYAIANGARYLVTFDADGQHQAAEIAKLVEPLVSGKVDVALGSRFAAGGSARNIPAARRLLLKLATFFTRLTTGLKVTDTHNGFRAFSSAAVCGMNLAQNRMAHASEILSYIASRKLRYLEVPVTIVYSEHTLQKGQKLSNSLNIIWESALGFMRR